MQAASWGTTEKKLYQEKNPDAMQATKTEFEDIVHLTRLGMKESDGDIGTMCYFSHFYNKIGGLYC